MNVSDLPLNMQDKIDVIGECWVWTGAKNNRGYGSVSSGVRGRTMLAHRKAYEATRGPIGEGLQIDHLCENTACVNPEHLEAVTAEEHARRVGHVDLKPIYAPAALNAYIPARRPSDALTALAARIAGNLAHIQSMPAEERAREDERHQRVHALTGTRCTMAGRCAA